MDTADETESRSFELQSSEIQFQAIFERPSFDWIQNWTRLSASVFDRLQPHGLSLADIKVEAAGSFADFQLTASLLGSSTVVRLKLENMKCIATTPSARREIAQLMSPSAFLRASGRTIPDYELVR